MSTVGAAHTGKAQFNANCFVGVEEEAISPNPVRVKKIVSQNNKKSRTLEVLKGRKAALEKKLDHAQKMYENPEMVGCEGFKRKF